MRQASDRSLDDGVAGAVLPAAAREASAGVSEAQANTIVTDDEISTMVLIVARSTLTTVDWFGHAGSPDRSSA